jgi:hypothetical protein
MAELRMPDPCDPDVSLVRTTCAAFAQESPMSTGPFSSSRPTRTPQHPIPPGSP